MFFYIILYLSIYYLIKTIITKIVVYKIIKILNDV